MNEQRLIELEIKAAYQEDLLQTLNTIVAEQQRQITLLELTCQHLSDRISNLRFEQAETVADQPPPHY